MEKFGRRYPLIIGGIWQSAWLFVFAAAGTAKDPSTDQGIGTLMIVSACLFIFGYAMTWAPGIWILTGETFPTRTRSMQAALAAGSNWIWNFLLAFFTPFIVKAIAFQYGFVFAACNLTGAVIVYFFLYESSDLSLEHVDQMYNDPTCKPWTSHRWAPEGFETRADVAEHNQSEKEQKLAVRDSQEQVEHHGGAEKNVGTAPNAAGVPRATRGSSDVSSSDMTAA